MKSHFDSIEEEDTNEYTPLIQKSSSVPTYGAEETTTVENNRNEEINKINENGLDPRKETLGREVTIKRDDVKFLSKLFFHQHISGNGRTMKRLTNIVKVLLILWDRHYFSISNELKKLSYLILVMCSSPHMKLLMQKVMEHHEKRFHKTLSQTDEKMWYEILFKESLDEKELKLLETHGGYMDFDDNLTI